MKIRTLALALALSFGLTTAGEAATKVKKSHVAHARVNNKGRSANAKRAAKMNKQRTKAAHKAHRTVKHS